MNRLVLLALVGALLLSACTPRGGAASQQAPDPPSSAGESAPQSVAPPSTPQPAPSAAPVFVEDEAFYNDVLLVYGAIWEGEGDNRFLRSDYAGLYYTGPWKGPDQLAYNGGFFQWYLHMMWQEDITDAQRAEKYKSPFGEGTGWFFPEAYFETAVQTYFDIDTETLRKNQMIYDAEHKGYYEGVGGIGERPKVILEDVEKDGDLRRLHILLQSVGGGSAGKKTLTIQLLPGEPGRYYYVGWDDRT